MMTNRHADSVVALILLVFCFLAWIQLGTVSRGAEVFPLLVLSALAVLSLTYLVRALLSPQALGAIFLDKGRFATVLALTVLYISIFSYVGYFTSTAVFAPLLAYAIGLRRPAYILISTVIFLAFVYVMFVYVFRRAVPPELLLTLLG